jgi:hypothetical protein
MTFSKACPVNGGVAPNIGRQDESLATARPLGAAWLACALLVAAVATMAFLPALRNSLAHDDVMQVYYWPTPSTPRQWLAAAREPW